MSRMYSPHWIRRVFELRLFLIANVAVLSLLLFSFGQEFARNYTIQQEIRRLQEQADTLSSRRLEMQELAQALQTETFIEREARLKLGLQKAGEQLVIVSPEDSEPNARAGSLAAAVSVTAPATDGSARTKRLSNARKWWFYFFDRETFKALARYGTPSSS
ncbi:septum formation initiator family protein [Candidatus Uhrbacteria bacterium]|nr:septum formation initiator family protein [Candidatus Uhrbacteria bacterium]